jgi:amino acid permease
MFERCREPWGIAMLICSGVGAVAALLLLLYLVKTYPVKGGTTVIKTSLNRGGLHTIQHWTQY